MIHAKDGTFGSRQDAEITYTPVDLKMLYNHISWSVKTRSNILKVAQWDPSPAYLVRKGQGELDLIRHGLSETSALKRHAEDGRTGPEGRASKTKRAHLEIDGRVWGLVISIPRETWVGVKGRSRMPVVP